MTTRFTRTGPLALLLTAALPAALRAHEGHGPEATWAGLVHWLSSPVHLVSVVALVAVGLGLAGVFLLRRRREAPAPAEERVG